jgi:hypothetical protein
MLKVSYALLAGLCVLVVVWFALYARTSTPQQAVYWYDSPIIARHNFSLGLLPCSASEYGQLVIILDSFRSSVPGPYLSLPVAPPCP